MLSKAKQALEFWHQRRVLFLCRRSSELLLDIRLHHLGAKGEVGVSGTRPCSAR